MSGHYWSATWKPLYSRNPWEQAGQSMPVPYKPKPQPLKLFLSPGTNPQGGEHQAQLRWSWANRKGQLLHISSGQRHWKRKVLEDCPDTGSWEDLCFDQRGREHLGLPKAALLPSALLHGAGGLPVRTEPYCEEGQHN